MVSSAWAPVTPGVSGREKVASPDPYGRIGNQAGDETSPIVFGDYKTDNHVTGYAKDKLLAWQTAPAGTEPKGWQWVYRLEDNGSGSTDVSLTYDWTAVTDPELLEKNLFPMVSEEQMEESLAKLAAEVG